ncbi:MAG TPA: hypothetical protein VKY85_16815 [Candidatus Angelobacter sp.]|nr:hypothetical protein [Candidatus Angelobacter sp.]
MADLQPCQTVGPTVTNGRPCQTSPTDLRKLSALNAGPAFADLTARTVVCLHLKLIDVVELESAIAKLACGRIRDEYAREAQLIQSALLPAKSLYLQSVEIAFRYIPFIEVGGDFVDFFLLPDGLIGIYLGDVMKAIRASMQNKLQGEPRAKEPLWPPQDHETLREK